MLCLHTMMHATSYHISRLRPFKLVYTFDESGRRVAAPSATTGRTKEKKEEEAPTASSHLPIPILSTTNPRRRQRRKKQPRRLYKSVFGCFFSISAVFYLISFWKLLDFSLLWIFQRGCQRHNNQPLNNCLAAQTTQVINRCFSYKGGEFLCCF